MTKRNVVLVIVFTIITIFIYGIYWMVATKNEMNRSGANIPTAWLMIVPIVQYWWLWKYCEGVERVSNRELSQVVAFLLLFLLMGPIGFAILQVTYNKAAERGQIPQAQAMGA